MSPNQPYSFVLSYKFNLILISATLVVLHGFRRIYHSLSPFKGSSLICIPAAQIHNPMNGASRKTRGRVHACVQRFSRIARTCTHLHASARTCTHLHGHSQGAHIAKFVYSS
ncbi:hypothetical protein CPC08DRAFT_69183 [Agrocybe pediades]|nr:hypothetical protein CPC08DRAFT_69183 [Agrocybe pediades]